MPNSTWDVSCADSPWEPDLPATEGFPLFIEMAQFYSDGRNEEWREAARWVKYEEDIEEGGQRWSKPYVPAIPLSALYELRKVLENAEIHLNFNANSEERAIRLLVDRWASRGVILESERAKILQTLLRPHVHLYETSTSLLPKIFKKKKPVERKSSSHSHGASDFLRRNSISSVVYRQPEKEDSQKNIQFLRKIPANAECANILVTEINSLKHPVAALLRLKEATVLGNMTEVPLPTRFVFILLAPPGMEFFEIGRAVGTLLTDPTFKEKAYRAEKQEGIVEALDAFISSTSILPPATWDTSIRLEPPTQQGGSSEHGEGEGADEVDDGLTRSGRLFGGFIADIKRKLPWYGSDIKDAISLQVLATWMFLYFACLTPMITFGGLMGLATHQAMGTMETMVAGCVCGVGFALFSGQPLLILGSTGPVLVFEKILVHFSESNDLNYLEFRLWVGIWIAGILMILVATDASALVSYITRFTEDNFATLIACIFMVEAFKNVMLIKNTHTVPLRIFNGSQDIDVTTEGSIGDPDFNQTTAWNWDYEVDHEDENSSISSLELLHGELQAETNQSVFLMSLLLFTGTFFISYMLKEFRVSPFFPTWFRYIVSDFAVILAIMTMTVIDFSTGIKTPKLAVPEKFAPTSPNRGWVISPFGLNPFWSVFAASIPALLATILIFMDQQITAVIINRKDHKLKKGSGYHLDLFVLAALITMCSILGLPWFVAATVESLTNLNSLKMESESAAPGEKPGFLGVREQRVSNILVFTTVGLSVLLTPVLRHVPMPVLYGVFLYMGFSALMRMELFQRILLFFMPLKHQPDHHYLRQVPLRRVHLFTIIQVLCLALLWIIKSMKSTAILFPLMLVVMMVVRKLLDYIFTQSELLALDDPLPERKSEDKKKRASESKSDALARVSVSIHPDVNGCKYKSVETNDV